MRTSFYEANSVIFSVSVFGSSHVMKILLTLIYATQEQKPGLTNLEKILNEKELLNDISAESHYDDIIDKFVVLIDRRIDPVLYLRFQYKIKHSPSASPIINSTDRN